MSPIRSSRLRVVVDGSNFATEGRVTPSLAQLDEAVRAFIDEHPNAEMIVVADASFEHRVAPNERAHFKEAELAGEIVTPPAGAIGRGDAFILKIADRIKGVVLSNDSFQEFHDEYPWLFDEGRLIGGKPVKGVGWVFTPRLPVRNTKTTRPVKKLSVTLSDGAKPSIGTTLTPVKATKAKKVADQGRQGAAQGQEVAQGRPAPKRRPSRRRRRSPVKVAKAPPKPKKAAKSAEAPMAPPPAVALRRGRHPVNPEADFALFRAAHRIGSRVEGEVTAFTSHGAVIKVVLKNGQSIECYAPTTSLGDPAPARARDVLKRGDRRTFRLVAVDAERRIAELALP